MNTFKLQNNASLHHFNNLQPLASQQHNQNAYLQYNQISTNSYPIFNTTLPMNQTSQNEFAVFLPNQSQTHFNVNQKKISRYNSLRMPQINSNVQHLPTKLQTSYQHKTLKPLPSLLQTSHEKNVGLFTASLQSLRPTQMQPYNSTQSISSVYSSQAYNVLESTSINQAPQGFSSAQLLPTYQFSLSQAQSIPNLVLQKSISTKPTLYNQQNMANSLDMTPCAKLPPTEIQNYDVTDQNFLSQKNRQIQSLQNMQATVNNSDDNRFVPTSVSNEFHANMQNLITNFLPKSIISTVAPNRNIASPWHQNLSSINPYAASIRESSLNNVNSSTKIYGLNQTNSCANICPITNSIVPSSGMQITGNSDLYSSSNQIRTSFQLNSSTSALAPEINNQQLFDYHNPQKQEQYHTKGFLSLYLNENCVRYNYTYQNYLVKRHYKG